MSWIEDPGETFEDLDLTKLGMDQAYVRIQRTNIDDVWLYSKSSDCYNCPYTKIAHFNESSNLPIKVHTVHQEFWRITSQYLGDTVHENEKSDVLCYIEPSLGEFGVYDVKVSNNTDGCSFNVAKEAVNIYLPMLIVFFILFGLVLLWKLIPYLILRCTTRESSDSDIDAKRGLQKRRIKSLDTFRGLSIVVMIFVNDGAGGYWWLEHATWNGLTVADLVFPFFLWIMGVCIPVSVKSIVSKDMPKYEALLQIFRRACTLFLIGVALGSLNSPTIDKLRIFGVLQRFGISYWAVASLVLILTKKNKEEAEGKYWKMVKDVTDLGVEWIIMIVLIIIHLLVTFLVPVPGCPTGYLGPGGKHENWLYKDCIGGVTKHIDLEILGDGHIYQNPTAKTVYDSSSFDPEGVFGCLLSIVHVFFGVQAGYTLLHHVEWKPVVIRWLIWGLVTGLIGGVLCNFSQEDGVIPVNKNLWSLSFVLVTTFFAFTVLSIFYILIDVSEWWDGSPFIQPGMNAITMYIGHTICYSIFPIHWKVIGMRTHFLHVLESVWGTLLWIVIAFRMVKKKIFLTI